MEIIEIALLTVQLLVVVVSVGYLARQVHGEKQAIGFQVYTQVTDTYLRHLWLASEKPMLNEVWDPWGDDPRREELRKAQSAVAAGEEWGAWRAMTDDERTCYRYTRQALEIFEQAWELRRRNLIPQDTWTKWENWMRIWKGTRYFEFVFADTRTRLLAPFCQSFEDLC